MDGEHQHDLLFDALELKMLVLQECEGGHYHQIMLTPEQFKAISDLTVLPITEEEKLTPEYIEAALDCPPGVEMKHPLPIKYGWKLPADAFLGLGSSYSQEEIDVDIKKWEDEDDGDEEV